MSKKAAGITSPSLRQKDYSQLFEQVCAQIAQGLSDLSRVGDRYALFPVLHFGMAKDARIIGTRSIVRFESGQQEEGLKLAKEAAKIVQEGTGEKAPPKDPQKK